MQSSTRRGFTLIELLVVISIVALLISILLPALGKARKTAEVTSCLTRVRSVNQMLAMYGADNKTYFPYGQDVRAGTSDNQMRMYHQSLNPYFNIININSVQNDAINSAWHCPAIERELAYQANASYRRFGVYCNNPMLMGWLNGSGYHNSGSYSLFTSGFTNVKESDLGATPFSRLATFMDGFKPIQFTASSACPVNMGTQWVVSAPHFEAYSPRDYDVANSGSNGNGGNITAAGGKASVAFLDGHTALIDPVLFDTGSGLNGWTVRP